MWQLRVATVPVLPKRVDVRCLPWFFHVVGVATKTTAAGPQGATLSPLIPLVPLSHIAQATPTATTPVSVLRETAVTLVGLSPTYVSTAAILTTQVRIPKGRAGMRPMTGFDPRWRR